MTRLRHLAHGRPAVVFVVLALVSVFVVLTWRALLVGAIAAVGARVVWRSRLPGRTSSAAAWAQAVAIAYAGRKIASTARPSDDVAERLLEHMARFHPELLGSSGSGGHHGAEAPSPSRERD